MLISPPHAIGDDEQGIPYLLFQGSGQWLFWTPGLKTQSKELVKYKTEGLASYATKAILGYGAPIITISKEGPFDTSSSRQQDMFISNKQQSAGFEKLTAGIDIKPILLFAFPYLEKDYFLKTLLSVEFNHSETVFYGNAEASIPFMFLPSNAIVDMNNHTVIGAIKLDSGTSLSFRTKFIDNEIMFNLFDYNQYSFKLGYYSMEWERPSDNNYSYTITDGTTAYPILFETTYKSEGVAASIKNNDSTAPGFNFDLSLQLSTNSKIKSAWERQFKPNESIGSSKLKAGIWYNWRLFSDTRKGFSATIGVATDYRRWQITTRDAQGNTVSDQTIDEERLERIYAQVGYNF